MKLSLSSYLPIIGASIILLGSVVGAVSAKDIDVAVGWTKPPYVIEENDTGFEIDLLKEIFNGMGHTITPIYVPYGRSFHLLKIGKVDIAMTLSNRLDITPAVMSDTYINYHNVAISLKGRGIIINNISELKNYALVGFQNASMFLGEEYKAASQATQFYLEIPDQKKQVEMLLLGRTDVVVMDINIFNYLSREILGKSHMNNVDIHRIFPVSSYHLGFYDAKLKDEFNKAFAAYIQTPAYQALIQKYEFLE